MDKAIRKSFIILCLSASLCGAQTEQELFVRGNKAYEQNQWGEALRSYEAISKKGCAVWYNMGNCFYKKGNGSQAIICWKRAMPGASVDEQLNIAKNLRSAYEKLGYKKDGPVYTLFEQWAYRLPLLPLQLFFLLCWYALWIIPLVDFRGRFFLLYGALLGLCFMMVLIGNILRTHYYLYAHTRGQVVKEQVHLFAGPHEQYHEVGTVALTDEVRIDEKRAGWYKVARGNQYGWISSAAVEPI